MRIVFQGDSITDSGRSMEDGHQLGFGYPAFVAQLLRERFPEENFEFINLGISCEQTMHLVNRLQRDFVEVQPDILSILIGVNDTWAHAEDRQWLCNDLFEERYRTILETVKSKTNAKILVIEPFLIPIEDKKFFREDMDPKIHIIRKLAREYADAYLPLDGLLASAYVGDDPLSFAADGVHPTEKGARYIASLYVDYVVPLLSK